MTTNKTSICETVGFAPHCEVLDTARKRIADLEEQLETQQGLRGVLARAEKAEARVVDLEDSVGLLREECRQAEEDQTFYQDRAEKAEAENARLRLALQIANDAVETAQRTCHMEPGYFNLQRERDEARAQATREHTENDRFRAAFEPVRCRYDSDGEYTDVPEMLRQAVADLQSDHDELTKLRAEVARLRTAISQAQDAISSALPLPDRMARVAWILQSNAGHEET